MEDKSNKEIETTEALKSFYNKNRIKIFGIIFLFIISIIILLFFDHYNKNKNDLISEKYIQAGLYLASNDKENSRKLFEEIIISKHSFYSSLALNTILEKNLIIDKNKILEYFEIVEKLKNSEEANDLVMFRKALFLIKNLDEKKGREILEELIVKNSQFKILAEEIIKK